MLTYPLLLFCFYILLAPGHLGFFPACCYPVIAPTKSDIQFGFCYFNLDNRSVLDIFYTSPLALSVLTALENYPHCDIFCPSLLPKDHNTEVMLMTEVPTSHPREAQSINWDVGKINSMPLKPQLLVLPPLRAQTLH